MYTNIPTNTAIMLLAKYIRKSISEDCPKQNEALIAALKLVMLNNIFSFGDMTFKQLNGTAMGTPPGHPPPPPPPPTPPPHPTPIYPDLLWPTRIKILTQSSATHHIVQALH